MRTLTPSTLSQYVKRYRYLVYDRYVYESAVLTQIQPGQLAETDEGQPLWIVTQNNQSISWEFHDRTTAIEIQQHESYVHHVTDHLARHYVDQTIRSEVRDRIIKILLWHADDLTAPAVSPKLCSVYPSPPSLA